LEEEDLVQGVIDSSLVTGSPEIYVAQETKKRLGEEKKLADKALTWDVGTSSDVVLSNEGKTIIYKPRGFFSIISFITLRATQGWTTGRHTWNISVDNHNGMSVGFVTSDFPYSGPSDTFLGTHKATAGFCSGDKLDGKFPEAPGHPSSCPKFNTGSVLTLCLDLDTKEFFIDDLSGKATGTVNLKKWYHNLPVGNNLTYFPAVTLYKNSQVTLKASLNN